MCIYSFLEENIILFLKKIFYATDSNVTFFKFCTISLSFAEVRPQVKEFVTRFFQTLTMSTCARCAPHRASRPHPLPTPAHLSMRYVLS